MHFKLVSLFGVQVSFGIEIPNLRDVIESLAAHRARIHPQRAADISGNAFHPLEAADLRVARGVRELLLLHADARGDLPLAHFDRLEFAARQMNDHAADAAVTHEQIRAAAHYEQRDLMRHTMFYETRESRFRFRLQPELCGPTDTQRRVFVERLVKPRRPASHHAFQLFEPREIAGDLRSLLVNVARAEAHN